MAPDRVGALLRVTGGLVSSGVDDLEVVDVAVPLVEVAVAVEVVPVPTVEGLQVLGRRRDVREATRRDLLVDPDVDAVADELPRVVADVAPAEVTPVAGLVEGDLHPLGDVAPERVAPGRLLLVERLHPVEVHVLVVGLVVVPLPHGRVVDDAVRLRDAVVQRAHVRSCGAVRVEADGRRRHRARVSRARELDVPGVVELRDDHEDPVRLLEGHLHELALGRLVDLAYGLACELLLQRQLLEAKLLLRELGLDVVCLRPPCPSPSRQRRLLSPRRESRPWPARMQPRWRARISAFGLLPSSCAVGARTARAPERGAR